MKEKYKNMAFQPETLKLLAVLNGVIREYQDQGYVLSLRQLYYQMVARGFIENTLPSYKRLGGHVNNGRLAGMLDWAGIEDRTREFIRRPRWRNGSDVLRAAADGYHEDPWIDQDRRVYVVIEKAALVGVLGPVCSRYDVPLLAAIGYPSPTVLREFSLSDVVPSLQQGQRPLILHLGDHDPSGLDMTRDLQQRINLFSHQGIELRRIALNIDQVHALNPPPNFAKETDARYAQYKLQYGSECWELDAIAPVDLDRLIEDNVRPLIDWNRWNARGNAMNATKQRLREVAENWR